MSSDADAALFGSAAPLVLIAEDQADARELAVMILVRAGLRTVHVDDGREALASARLMRPAVIVLDLGMPHLDGMGVLAQLRRFPETRDIPVIVLSGADEDVLAKARARGATSVCRKPCSPEYLVELVLRAVAGGQAREHA
ncbi:MAG: response regulator [Myxococcota bacterium]|nr:response regulator [Myxococcota bacterium]